MEQETDLTKSDTPAQAPPPLGPSPEVREVLYRAFVLGFVIILGCIILVIAAVSVGSGVLAAPVEAALPVTTTIPTQTSAAATTVTSPPTTSGIDYLPPNMYVGVSVEKNSAGKVTVNFLGGEGRALVKEIEARLFLSDGTMVTGTMTTQSDFPQIVLQGTKTTDRIEVYARLYSGKIYKIADQQVIYPVRVGSRPLTSSA